MKKKLLLTTLILTLTGTALCNHHTVTNASNNQIRIEGFNTANPEDLYFSELVEPGQSKSYLAGTHYPNFAIRVMHDSNESLQLNPSAKVAAKSDELPNTGSHITVQQKGDKRTVQVDQH